MAETTVHQTADATTALGSETVRREEPADNDPRIDLSPVRQGELRHCLCKAYDWLENSTPKLGVSGTEAVAMHERMGVARFLIETLADVLENELGVGR